MYSTDDGTIKSEKPQDMEQLHVSSGWAMFQNPERMAKPSKRKVNQ